MLCELSFGDFLVWMLGYVEFDLSVLEMCDFKIDLKPISTKP